MHKDMPTKLQNRNPIFTISITVNDNNGEPSATATETESVNEIIVSYTTGQGIPQGAMLMPFLLPLYNSNSL